MLDNFDRSTAAVAAVGISQIFGSDPGRFPNYQVYVWDSVPSRTHVHYLVVLGLRQKDIVQSMFQEMVCGCESNPS